MGERGRDRRSEELLPAEITPRDSRVSFSSTGTPAGHAIAAKATLAAAPETTKKDNKELFLAREAVSKYSKWLTNSEAACTRNDNNDLDLGRPNDEAYIDEKNRKLVQHKFQNAITVLRKHPNSTRKSKNFL